VLLDSNKTLVSWQLEIHKAQKSTPANSSMGWVEFSWARRPVSRGGGPLMAILAQPGHSINGRIKITEQESFGLKYSLQSWLSTWKLSTAVIQAICTDWV